LADGDLLALRVALARVQRLSDDHWHVLDATCAAMDDDAWAGPAGRRFAVSVRVERAELRTQLTRAVRSAEDALAKTP
jgi:hypothetical protein